MDQGPQLQSKKFKILLAGAGIQIHSSGMESNNALENGEMYHSYLRSLYATIRDDVTQLSK